MSANQDPLPQPKTLLTERYAAKLLAVSYRTLQRWRWEGRGPAYQKIGRAVRYLEQDLWEYVKAGRCVPGVDESSPRAPLLSGRHPRRRRRSRERPR